jgi:hypothetical protein
MVKRGRVVPPGAIAFYPNGPDSRDSGLVPQPRPAGAGQRMGAAEKHLLSLLHVPLTLNFYSVIG